MSVSAHMPSMQGHQHSGLKPLPVQEEGENQKFASQMEDFLSCPDDSSKPS